MKIAKMELSLFLLSILVITDVFRAPCTTLAFSVRTPTITYISKNLEVDIGSSAELECSVQFAHDFSVLWVKKAKDDTEEDLPISTNSALIIRDSRYSLRNDRGSTTYILQIKDLQEYDGGIYMCQVIIDYTNRISKTLKLEVRQPPMIFDNSTRTVMVPRGAAVKLECYATGAPPPKVSWRRENNALLPTGGSVFSGTQLLIPNIRKEDRGTYYCIAENGVGRGAKRNINVEVEFEPIAVALKPVVRQAQGFEAILQCRAESFPPSEVSWVFRSESIVSKGNFRISQFSTDNEYLDSLLTVSKIGRREYGNYTCKAYNRLGQAQASIILKESYDPVCPPACELPYTYGASDLVLPSLITIGFALGSFLFAF